MINIKRFVVILIMLMVVISGCKEEKKSEEAVVKKVLSVRTAQARVFTINDIIKTTGTLTADDEYTISNETEGKIKAVYVDMGDYVRKGQLLAQINTQDYGYKVQSAAAELDAATVELEGLDNGSSLENHSLVIQAKARLDDAYLKMNRLKLLADQKLIPIQDYDSAQSNYIAAKATYENAKTTVKKLKSRLESIKAQKKLQIKSLADTRITSPISGYIQAKNVSNGEFLRINTTMFTIVQTNKLKIRTSIPERYANTIKKGLKVSFKVESLPNKSFSGVITRIAPAIDTKTRTFETEILVNNQNNILKAGQFCNIAIDLGTTHQGIFVPEKAVYSVIGLNKIYTVNDNRLKEHLVELKEQRDDWIEIINHIKPGDSVVTTNLSDLTDGETVKVINPDEAKK